MNHQNIAVVKMRAWGSSNVSLARWNRALGGNRVNMHTIFYFLYILGLLKFSYRSVAIDFCIGMKDYHTEAVHHSSEVFLKKITLQLK